MNDTRTDNLPLAVTVITFVVLALSMMDATIKATGLSFSIWQIFFLRSLPVLPVLALVLYVRSPAALSVPPALGWVILRSLVMVAMWLAYYVALPHLDLSAAAAVYYLSPIFITLFSALFLRQRIGALGWSAVCIGFLGVVLILRPDADAFNIYALLPLFSAVLYAVSAILTRAKCRDVHPVMLGLALNMAFVIVGVVGALAVALFPEAFGRSGLGMPWQQMTPGGWATILLFSAAILFASVGAAIAYQKGPPSVIGAFDFAYVGFAVLWGIVFFAEIPDMMSWAGIGLIVLAGIMSLRQ